MSATVRADPGRAAVALGALLLVLVGLLGFGIGRGAAARHGKAPATAGAVDVGFAQDMTTHHEQAVLMANLALTRGSPAVQAIADGILIAQSEEIGQMEGWLQLWHQPLADPHPMAWMGGMGSMGRSPSAASMAGSANLMPGMASAQQLAALYDRRGRSFDVLFLQLMIRHHEGGIEMAHYAETHARLVYVRRAATAMRIEEVQDLGVMEPLLRADGGRELPAP